MLNVEGFNESYFDIKKPSKFKKHSYEYIRNTVIKDLRQLKKIGKPAFYLFQMTRGEGKTYLFSRIVNNILSKEGSESAVIAGVDHGAIWRNVIKSPDSPFLDYKELKGNAMEHKESGAKLYTASMHSVKTLISARGMHPNIFWGDDLQQADFEDFMAVFGNMGIIHNCIYMLTATGGTKGTVPYELEKILKEEEKKPLRDREFHGIARRIDPYELYRENPSKQRFDVIKMKERAHTKEERHFLDDPNFWLERMAVNLETGAEDDLAFPFFKNYYYEDGGNLLRREDIERGAFVPDWKNGQFYAIFDTGSKDPYCIHLFTIINGKAVMLKEVYNKARHKTPDILKTDLYHMLSDCGFEIEDWSAGSHDRYHLKSHNVMLFGDQHGFSNWNYHISLAFGVEVDSVGTAKDGIDAVNTYLQTNKLLISEECTNGITSLLNATRSGIAESKNSRGGKGAKKNHEHFSHAAVPSCYFVQIDLINHADLISDAFSEAIENEEKEQESTTNNNSQYTFIPLTGKKAKQLMRSDRGGMLLTGSRIYRH